MGDSVLSQDELDALLQGTSLENNDSDSISNSEEIILNKLFNDLGKARAGVLGQLTNSTITLDQVNFLTGTSTKLSEDLTSNLVGNSSSITGGITGSWMICAPESSVFQVANKMLGSESTEISEEVIEAFGEAISNMMASDTKILSEQLKLAVSPSLAESQRYDSGSDFITTVGSLYRIGINLNIDGASYPFYIISSMKFIKSIAKILNPQNNPSANAPQPTATNANSSTVNMTPAQFQQFNPSGNIEPLDNLALLLDVPMRVTVELGRTRMTIKDILNLGEGSIVELEKLAGEPVDVLVNDKLIALGEVVVIDENFSVRVTKVVTPMERIFDRENLHGKGGV